MHQDNIQLYNHLHYTIHLVSLDEIVPVDFILRCITFHNQRLLASFIKLSILF